MQGLGLRKNSRRTPEKLFGEPAEAKEPQKRHVQGSDGRNRYEGWLVGVRRGWRRKHVAGKWLTRPHVPAREMQLPVGKTHVAGAWVVFWLRCFGKNWRSPPGAPYGVGKRHRWESSAEKSPAVNVFWRRFDRPESFGVWGRWPEWNTVIGMFPGIDITRKLERIRFSPLALIPC